MKRGACITIAVSIIAVLMATFAQASVGPAQSQAGLSPSSILVQECDCPEYDGTLHVAKDGALIIKFSGGELALFTSQYMKENSVDKKYLKRLKTLEGMGIRFKLIADPADSDTIFVTITFTNEDQQYIYDKVMMDVFGE
jgi:hypothetical protein